MFTRKFPFKIRPEFLEMDERELMWPSLPLFMGSPEAFRFSLIVQLLVGLSRTMRAEFLPAARCNDQFALMNETPALHFGS
jgi:hypothetical protein